MDAMEEFKKVQLDITPFYALPGADPFQSFNRSQYAMCNKAYNLCIDNWENHPAIFFEDDVIFKETDHLHEAIHELPAHWGILYLGCNLTDPLPRRASKHLVRVFSAWTTHAVAYSWPVLQYIITHYNADKDGMFDDWLSRNVLTRFPAYVVNPMICWQRPGKSDLWGNMTDYTPCFIGGNEKMAAL